VDNPIPVPLIGRAKLAGGLLPFPPPALDVQGSVRAEHFSF